MIKNAVEAHERNANGQDETQGFISLDNALDAIETISLEPRSLRDMSAKPTGDPELAT